MTRQSVDEKIVNDAFADARGVECQGVVGRLLDFVRRHSHVNWALTDQAIVSGVNFLTSILLARYLGLREFGVFSLAWMAVLFANGLQFALVSSPMMSIGPKQDERSEAQAYYGAVFIQQVALAIVSSVLLYTGVKLSGLFFPDWGIQHLALPLAAAAFAFQMQDFLRRYFFTRSRAGTAFFNDAISYLGQLSVLVWLFWTMEINSAWVLWIIAGTSTVAVIVGLFGLEPLSWNKRVLRAVTVRHWHFSKWLIGAFFMRWMSGGNFFTIVAGVMLGASVVGVLKAAQNIVGIIHVLFQGLENIVPVQCSKFFKIEGAKGLMRYLRRVTLLGGAVTACITTIVFLFPEFLLGTLYGDELSQYGNVLRLFAILYLFTFFGLPVRSGLRALEHTRPIFSAHLLLTIISLITAYPIVEKFGLLGVMIGLIASQIILFGVTAWAFAARVKKV